MIGENGHRATVRQRKTLFYVHHFSFNDAEKPTFSFLIVYMPLIRHLKEALLFSLYITSMYSVVSFSLVPRIRDSHTHKTPTLIGAYAHPERCHRNKHTCVPAQVISDLLSLCHS